jgi:hypothetical protein
MRASGFQPLKLGQIASVVTLSKQQAVQSLAQRH